MEVTITKENFASLKAGNQPLVVDFWATWCGPCRMVAPIIDELAKQYDGKIVVGKCDVEDNEELALRSMVSATFLPSFSSRMVRLSTRLSALSRRLNSKRNSKHCFKNPYPTVTTRLPSFFSSIVTLTASSGRTSSISSGHSMRQRHPL